jgi:hypothetical protein
MVKHKAINDTCFALKIYKKGEILKRDQVHTFVNFGKDQTSLSISFITHITSIHVPVTDRTERQFS